MLGILQLLGVLIVNHFQMYEVSKSELNIFMNSSCMFGPQVLSEHKDH